MEMVIHMCRLKDTRTMWNFQAAFVNALRIAFPEHHPPGPGEAKKPEPEAVLWRGLCLSAFPVG